jgi:polysaccharide export outer membrane protein
MGTHMLVSFALVMTLAGAARAQPPAAHPPPQTQPPPVTQPDKPTFDIAKSDVPSGSPPRQGTPVAGETYVIGPQDNLQITVTDETDLSGKYRVDTDGTITFPYLQRVPLAGLSLADAQTRIASMLRNGYVRNPQVRIEVDQFKSRRVIVTGEVRTAGPVTMAGTTMTLIEALAMAGSPTQSASNEIIVQHPPKAGEKAPDPIVVNRKDLELGRADITLQDGDVINVPVAKRFFISGMVKNPGAYVFDPGMTVSQAIVLSGGLNDRGSDRRIKIGRTVNGKIVDVSVELDAKVQPGDEIKISPRFF